VLERLPAPVRHDLLRVLAGPSPVRADAARQFYERGDHALFDVIVELEKDEVMRLSAVEALQGVAVAGGQVGTALRARDKPSLPNRPWTPIQPEVP
jgi:hypothetical protein